jgi:hypothetical protein
VKRPALVVVFLYLVAILALTWPVVKAAFWPQMSTSDIVDGMTQWVFWAFVAVMVVGQAALLVLPVKVASRRPTTRRSLLWPIVVAGLMVGGLVMGGVAAVAEFIQRDRAFDSAWMTWGACGAGALSWLVWSIAFYRSRGSSSPADVVSHQCRLMLRGSFLEFLIAVPTHIVARSRGYCCAGAYTFVGIALGLAVMLLSFGPAVFFLFADRWKRLHPESSPVAPAR